MIDSLVASLPVGAQREQMRSRIVALSDLVERTPGWQSHNLAQATYLLAALSLSKVNGTALDTSHVRELVQGIDDAYARDAAFQAMSDAARSRIYYLTSTPRPSA